MGTPVALPAPHQASPRCQALRQTAGLQTYAAEGIWLPPTLGAREHVVTDPTEKTKLLPLRVCVVAEMADGDQSLTVLSPFTLRPHSRGLSCSR